VFLIRPRVPVICRSSRRVIRYGTGRIVPGTDTCIGYPAAGKSRRRQRVMLSPGKIGGIAQAALVLVQFEHKMIT
jgi:hypothetical protein